MALGEPMRGGRQAHRPGERDRRIQRRLADADLRRLRGQLHLGRAHVGPAPQQLGRHVDDHLEPRLGNLRASRLHLGQRTGRPCEQHAQRVLRLAQAALELGDRRQRAQVLRTRLLHVELGLVAAAEQAFGDLQAALLQRGVLVRDAQPQLGGADRCVQAGGLRRDQHLHVVVLRDAGEVGGIGRLDAAPELAPEVQLPGQVESQAAGPERRTRGRSLPRLPDAQRLAAELLQLRIQRAAGDAELGARLHDAQAGGAHVGVQALRFGDQLVEHRVVEIAPPFVVAGLSARGASSAACASAPPDQPCSQGTCGALKSGPSVVQAPSSTSGQRAAARRTSPRRGAIGGAHSARPRSGRCRSPSAVSPSGLACHPAHEDLVAQRQQRRADEHAEDAGGGHAAQRAEQDHRHRRIDAAAEHQRLEHVVGHAGDEQQHRVQRRLAGAVVAARPDVADRRQA